MPEIEEPAESNNTYSKPNLEKLLFGELAERVVEAYNKNCYARVRESNVIQFIKENLQDIYNDNKIIQSLNIREDLLNDRVFINISRIHKVITERIEYVRLDAYRKVFHHVRESDKPPHARDTEIWGHNFFIPEVDPALKGYIEEIDIHIKKKIKLNKFGYNSSNRRLVGFAIGAIDDKRSFLKNIYSTDILNSDFNPEELAIYTTWAKHLVLAHIKYLKNRFKENNTPNLPEIDLVYGSDGYDSCKDPWYEDNRNFVIRIIDFFKARPDDKIMVPEISDSVNNDVANDNKQYEHVKLNLQLIEAAKKRDRNKIFGLIKKGASPYTKESCYIPGNRSESPVEILSHRYAFMSLFVYIASFIYKREEYKLYYDMKLYMDVYKLAAKRVLEYDKYGYGKYKYGNLSDNETPKWHDCPKIAQEAESILSLTKLKGNKDFYEKEAIEDASLVASHKANIFKRSLSWVKSVNEYSEYDRAISTNIVYENKGADTSKLRPISFVERFTHNPRIIGEQFKTGCIKGVKSILNIEQNTNKENRKAFRGT